MAPVFALLVIDMSQEQLYPDGSSFLPENWKGYGNILKLSKLLPKEKVFDSRLWMTPEDNSTLFELYPVGRANTAAAALVSQLKTLEATFVKKVQYSSFFHSELEGLLRAQGVTDILVTGINTDMCVFASSLDAFYRGFKLHLIKDACATVVGPAAHLEGIRRFELFFGSYGNVTTTRQMAELLKNS